LAALNLIEEIEEPNFDDYIDGYVEELAEKQELEEPTMTLKEEILEFLHDHEELDEFSERIDIFNGFNNEIYEVKSEEKIDLFLTACDEIKAEAEVAQVKKEENLAVPIVAPDLLSP
jgi:hypothetical protein